MAGGYRNSVGNFETEFTFDVQDKLLIRWFHFYAIEERCFKAIQLAFIFLKPFERFRSLSDPVGTSTLIYFVHAAVTLDYYSAEFGLLHKKERPGKREYDRKDRRIVDRKPEENEKFWSKHFHSSILNQAACLVGTRAP